MDQIAYDALTPRERDCLRLVADGLQAGEVATRLGLSKGRVENLMKAARGKLGGVPGAVAARELRMFEAVHPVDVQPMDLLKPTGDLLPLDSRLDAGANAVREERATFDWGTEPAYQSIEQKRLNGPWTLVAIASLVALMAIIGSLAYPLAEGWQHLTNLFDPPKH